MFTDEEPAVPTEDRDFQVGRLAGRLDATDSRMDRFEATTAIWRTNVDTKLDTITSALLRQEGRHTGRGDIGRWAIGFSAVCGGLLIWALSHVGGITLH